MATPNLYKLTDTHENKIIGEQLTTTEVRELLNITTKNISEYAKCKRKIKYRYLIEFDGKVEQPQWDGYSNSVNKMLDEWERVRKNMGLWKTINVGLLGEYGKEFV